MANVNLYCPNCQRVDSVQKISAIVNGGISFGRYNGYANGYYDSAYINITNYNQTRLSKLLFPPKNPYKAIRHYSSESVYIKELAGIAAVGLAALGCMLVIIFAGPSSQYSCLTTMILLTLLTTISLFFWVFTNLKKSRTDNAWAESQMPNWISIMTRWHQMYYCHRCDGIFLPGEDVLIPVK